jgi:hypothetical protein
MVDNHPGSPPPPDEGPKKYDTAGPFFSLYSDVAGDVDNKMTERWQQDATDGILVFVSTCVRHSCNYPCKLRRYSPVYSLPPSLCYSRCLSLTCSKLHKTPPQCISRIFTRFLPIQTSRFHVRLSLQLLPIQPLSLHRHMPSG